MYPPSTFLPYASGDVSGGGVGASASSNAVAAASGRLVNFGGGVSPSQSPSNFLPALPKFQQAFGKKSHFDGIMLHPTPTGAMTGVGGPGGGGGGGGGAGGGGGGGSTAVLPGINPLQDNCLQQVDRMGLTSTGNSTLVTNNIQQRFSGSGNEVSGNHTGGSHGPPAEEEGLGSKLQSLLESALNGQISRSPTRSTILNPETGSNCISPLVSGLGDSQSGSENVLLSEQLREFESVFERVAGSTRVEQRSDWSTELANQEDAYVHAPYLAPPSNFSETMDVPDASPHRSPLPVPSPLPIPSPGSEERNNTCSATEAGTETEAETEAPLMQLLTVASAARQALEDEEKGSTVASVASPAPSETSGISPSLPLPAPEEHQQVAMDDPSAASLTAALPEPASSVSAATPVPVAATATAGDNDSSQPALSAASVPASAITSANASANASTNASALAPGGKLDSAKTNRNRASNKSSPVVSPGSTSPSKATGGAGAGTGAGTGAGATVAGTAATATGATATGAGAAGAGAAAPKAPQKAHDDEHTVSRVNAILEEYKEQLRNSPDLQNKPAPRR